MLLLSTLGRRLSIAFRPGWQLGCGRWKRSLAVTDCGFTWLEAIRGIRGMPGIPPECQASGVCGTRDMNRRKASTRTASAPLYTAKRRKEFTRAKADAATRPALHRALRP